MNRSRAGLPNRLLWDLQFTARGEYKWSEVRRASKEEDDSTGLSEGPNLKHTALAVRAPQSQSERIKGRVGIDRWPIGGLPGSPIRFCEPIRQDYGGAGDDGGADSDACAACAASPSEFAFGSESTRLEELGRSAGVAGLWANPAQQSPLAKSRGSGRIVPSSSTADSSFRGYHTNSSPA